MDINHPPSVEVERARRKKASLRERLLRPKTLATALKVTVIGLKLWRMCVKVWEYFE